MTESVQAGATRSPQTTLDTLASLHDWRRRISDLYSAVRAMPPAEGWAHWRHVRDRLFGGHAQSPLDDRRRACFQALNYFPYDPALRFEVSLAPASNRGAIDIELGRDGRMKLAPYAVTHGLRERLGAELTLYWIEGYGGGVFVPFGDATNAKETFAGGRYLLDTIKSADLGQSGDGRMIFDFNFAYYPSCAYSEAWVCPLSPSENRLPVPIRAGERTTPF